MKPLWVIVCHRRFHNQLHWCTANENGETWWIYQPRKSGRIGIWWMWHQEWWAIGLQQRIMQTMIRENRNMISGHTTKNNRYATIIHTPLLQHPPNEFAGYNVDVNMRAVLGFYVVVFPGCWFNLNWWVNREHETSNKTRYTCRDRGYNEL